jgi:PAT family beta-lactamase induction signal transducer AmpG
VSLAERRNLRMFTLCVLYVAQGIPWGFMAFTLPAILADRGQGPAVIGGVLAMTTLPYSFKWAWGFLIDAFPSKRWGRRRPWIIVAQGMMAATVGAMILIPDLTASVRLLTLTVFVHTVFNSMQDVAVDALAVDLLDDKERGRANGLMYASKWGGGALGGWGLSHLVGWAGLRPALGAQTAVLFAIMCVPLLVRERGGEDQAPSRAPVWSSIRAWSRRVFGERTKRAVLRDAIRDRAMQSAVLGIFVMLLSNVGAAIVVTFANVLFTQQLGWTAEDYAQLGGGPGLVAGLVGSLVGGFLADRVGHRRLAGLATVGIAIYYLAWAALSAHWADHHFVYAVFWIEPFLAGVMTVSLFALCMDISWTSIAASQFAIYMALANFSTTTGYKLGGYAAAWFTPRGVYFAAAVLQASFVLILPLIDPHAARRRTEGA